MGVARKINQLDFETGELIRTFDSMQEACDTYDLERASMYNALSSRDGYMKKRKLRFEYVGEYEIRKVRQLDYDTGEEVEVYNSAEHAANDNFLVPKQVREALRIRGGYMHQKKLRFEYIK